MVRVAGVGLGDLGRYECSVLADIDGVDLVAGADPSPTARERFAAELDAPAYASHERLFAHEDLDAVTIATPHTLHYGQVRDALLEDLHVHVEKPMVTDLADAHDLIHRARRRDRVLAVGYQRHFDPRFRELRRLIDEGRIGTPHMVACHLEQIWIRWTRHQWRGDPALSGGGQLYDSGSHLLDALLWCTRSVPVSVAAAIDRQDHAVDVNGALAAVLDRDGSQITVSIGVTGAGTSIPDPGEALHVWGTDGALAFDGERIRVTEGELTYEATPDDPGFDVLTRRKLQNVVDAIRGADDLQIPATDALKVTALTEAAYQAEATGERVTVTLDAGLD